MARNCSLCIDLLPLKPDPVRRTMEVICILVLGLRDVVVVLDAISPTADCGVDGILVLDSAM